MRLWNYSVVYASEDGGLIRADFRDYDSAIEYAKEHDSAVIRNDNFNSVWDMMKFRALNVGVVLSALFVLSVIGWGWISVLCEAGLI